MWQHHRKPMILIGMLILFILTACAATEEKQSSQPDYENTKKMIVDLLKTDEGKNAIKEILQDEKIKSEIIMDDDMVKDTIRTTLASEEGKEYWQKVMQEPEFAKAFSQTIQGENEKIIKGLMKDPEYQGMMISLLKDPEMQKTYSTLFQSKEYREHLIKVMEESFESPLFKAKLNEIFTKVAEEIKKKEEEKQQKKEEESKDSESSN